MFQCLGIQKRIDMFLFHPLQNGHPLCQFSVTSLIMAHLYITQPALSIAINSLEEELQYPLLKRTKKGVLLTEDGARVLQEAQMVLNTIQNWYLAKSEQEYELDGVVHIQAIPSICVAMSCKSFCSAFCSSFFSLSCK